MPRVRTETLTVALCLAISGLAGQSAMAATAPSATLPRFLPDWFATAVNAGGKPMHLVQQQTVNGREQYAWASDDQSVQLVVARAACSPEVCVAAMRTALDNANAQVSRAGGRFDTITATEFAGSWEESGARTRVSVFLLPDAVLNWTRRAPVADLEGTPETLLPFVNRLRYELLATADNVVFGRWSPQVNAHARHLLATGDKVEAVAILGRTVVSLPNDLAAQMDFAENSADAAAARASAATVFANAESPTLVARAARLLGERDPALRDIPPLEKNAEGLQVILVPLAPCDLRLVQEAAAIYETITRVPVRIRRLDADWDFGPPDRLAAEKQARQVVVELQRQAVDFTGWTAARYAQAIRAAVSGNDALTRYSAEGFVAQLEAAGGQHLVDPHLARFLAQLAGVRSTDARTMYVGITGANIYSGELNYVFSQFTRPADGAGASILSYAMMGRDRVGAPYESRPQVAERLAKEMVPATLQNLGIPRAVDPTDPYSYSDGVERLAQKTLILSPPTRDALEKFRD